MLRSEATFGEDDVTMRHHGSARREETFSEDPVSEVRPATRRLGLDDDGGPFEDAGPDTEARRSTLLPPPMPRPVPEQAPAAAPIRQTSTTVSDVVHSAAWALVVVVLAVVFALAH